MEYCNTLYHVVIMEYCNIFIAEYQYNQYNNNIIVPSAAWNRTGKTTGYDLKKLLENISVLKSAEADKEGDGKSTEKPRRTTPMSIGELVEFLRSENAQEICVVNVPPEMHSVTCSGKGLRHISKIAHSLVDEVSEH